MTGPICEVYAIPVTFGGRLARGKRGATRLDEVQLVTALAVVMPNAWANATGRTSSRGTRRSSTRPEAPSPRARHMDGRSRSSARRRTRDPADTSCPGRIRGQAPEQDLPTPPPPMPPATGSRASSSPHLVVRPSSCGWTGETADHRVPSGGLPGATGGAGGRLRLGLPGSARTPHAFVPGFRPRFPSFSFFPPARREGAR